MEEPKVMQKGWWSSQTRRQKNTFIIMAILSILVILLFILGLSSRELGIAKLADILYGENISGWAWLGAHLASSGISWGLTFGIIGVAFVVYFLLNFIIGIFTWKGKRSKTVGSLIKSLIKYIIVILAVGFILASWHVDVASIVAGLGIITLIIGLGCQSLIADIVSGLFLVFDDFFDVGDIVVIDGFRGTIAEIGLRSTKMIDWAGNIKSINNSEVKTVTNLSRLPTSIITNICIDRDEDLQRAEAVISVGLPYIKDSLPKITGSLTYIGVSNIKEAGIELAFCAECAEANRYQVNRDLQRELLLLMKENNIKVAFNLLHVLEEKERQIKPASEEEKAKAKAINELNRELPAEETDEKPARPKKKK